MASVSIRPGQTATRKHPKIRTVDGQVHSVDEDGLIGQSGRLWPVGSPPSESDIQAAASWLQLRTQQIKSPGVGSYAAKHAAEKYIGRYIPNGAIIVAAYRLGIRQVAESINSGLFISSRAFERLPESKSLGV